ncbi:hypothetical protein [Ruegeria arenilitoris]|uniref:hypothetical protein n=1 Tax=Ruegeria arenilitoris TaxID=1173585 RepID=UPI00147DF046|nr:hypothetical protein [Ruegeria arenilitoris]
MSKVYASLSRVKKIEAVEQALDFVGAMVTQRADGETYIGLYETLEQELDALKTQDDTKARIRLRLASKSVKLAA